MAGVPAVPRPTTAALVGDLSPARATATAGATPSPARVTATAGATADVPRWQDAYVLMATGRYAAALARLQPLLGTAAEVASAAYRLRASVWRQLGLYDRGEADGARAVHLAGEVDDPAHRAELRAAALTGHVADAVGRVQSGDATAAGVLDERLLAARRCLAALDPAVPQRWRHVVRLGWVAGEVALTRGEAAEAELRLVEARAAARDADAPRHVAKSVLFLAGVAAASGDSPAADRLADDAARTARGSGALPLVWPALLIRAEVSPDVDAARALQGQAARILHAQLRDLPEAVGVDVARRHPCRWLLDEHPGGSDAGQTTPPAALR